MSPPPSRAARLPLPRLQAMPSFAGDAGARGEGGDARRLPRRRSPGSHAESPEGWAQLCPSYPPAGCGLAFCEPPGHSPGLGVASFGRRPSNQAALHAAALATTPSTDPRHRSGCRAPKTLPGKRAAARQLPHEPAGSSAHGVPTRPPHAAPQRPGQRGRRAGPGRAGGAAVSAAARLPPTGLVTAPLGLPRVPMGLPFCSSLATFPGGGPLTSGLPLPLSGLSRRQGLSLLRSMLGDAAPAGRSQ